VRVAIVHHWFVTRGGGERVAECIASLFPTAEIFTLVSDPAGIPEGLRDRKIHTSFLQEIPFAARYHRHLMPLYPEAAASLDLSEFDLVISSDSGPVKAIRVAPGATHICYCHSPMRYLYNGYETYRSQMSALTRAAFTATASRVRRRDLAAAQRVSHFIANSRYVSERIRRVYGRESVVIHPPIDVDRGHIAERHGKHYLCAGRLVSYKRTDLMIEACRRLGRRLRIAGTGPELARLHEIAGSDVEFLGELSNTSLWQEYADCRALLFAADEDFGMVSLEAQACGRPVVAFGIGGSLETVRGLGPRRTGVYYPEQTVESLMQAILAFEAADHRGDFVPANIQSWAAEFSTPVFLERMRQFVLSLHPEIEEQLISPKSALPVDDMIERLKRKSAS
jgi:glycosyltransferase involved in cell wall biosynthesis